VSNIYNRQNGHLSEQEDWQEKKPGLYAGEAENAGSHLKPFGR
jgi:hypothetical protein